MFSKLFPFVSQEKYDKVVDENKWLETQHRTRDKIDEVEWKKLREKYDPIYKEMNPYSIARAADRGFRKSEEERKETKKELEKERETHKREVEKWEQEFKRYKNEFDHVDELEMQLAEQKKDYAHLLKAYKKIQNFMLINISKIKI